MGKWKKVYELGEWRIYGTSPNATGCICRGLASEATADQIIREHNAHEGLMGSLKDVMARICDWCGECDDIGESSKPCKCILDARAVLAQA